MTERNTYLGIPLVIASPQELQHAVMHGEFIHRGAGMAGYLLDGKIYVVEADKPISLRGGDGELLDAGKEGK